jgi:S1-C subfamily serine protease
MNILLRPGLVLLAVLVMPTTASAQARSDLGAIWCHDTGRDVVARVMRDSCQGRIISEAEAQRIVDARAERLKRAIGNVAPDPGTGASPTAPAARAAPPPGRVAKSSGSGFFVNASGAVVTNDHVIQSCGAVRIVPFGGNAVDARVVARSTELDLAVVQASLTPPAVAAFSPDPKRTDPERSAVVGFPRVGMQTLQASLVGAYVHPNEFRQPGPRITFAGAVRPGHSGSPLLDQFADVIGVVHAKIDSVTTYKKTGREVRDLGYGLSHAATIGFLAKSNVSYSTGSNEAVLSDTQKLERARRFVARIQCFS